MNNKHIPARAMRLYEFSELEGYYRRFAEGHYNLLAIVGNAGLSKTESLLKMMEGKPHVYIKGAASPIGVYEMLYDNLNAPVILDDADQFYKEKDAPPLLKSLCETRPVKTLMWRKRTDLPRSFTTTSRVCIICNEWRTVGGRQNMEAIVDRALFFHFDPAANEVHRYIGAGGWYKDREAFDFIGEHLHLISKPSMRIYVHAAELHESGDPQWKERVLQMITPNDERRTIETVARLMADPILNSDERVARFIEQTGRSRRTFMRLQRVLRDRARSIKPSSEPKAEKSEVMNLVGPEWKALEESLRVAVKVAGKRKTARFASLTIRNLPQKK